MSVKGDSYYISAVQGAADEISFKGSFDCQISSMNGRFGITLFDEHYDAGEGDISDAANLALATLHEIASVNGKHLAMYRMQADVSTIDLSGVMSIRMVEEKP
ncbi:hypothetical protein [Pantoea eucrina]|uniref:hypothetical protein n=1 Tax=Pantoea eucrina TaxID=472693 RepID=UPI001CC36540|nr:hypothetical protein [Pantoea eucrina]UBB12377.1 hypothetical protein LAC65_11125 [Pantoea eucrina]